MLFPKKRFYSCFVSFITLSKTIILLSPAQAQIIIDGTTNTEITNTPNGVQINNGNREGGNLFHSFKEFSLPTDSEAFFNNANDIVNIFSRVTGGNISNIDGLIRANGGANLYLINPAGIIFGENARLDIGGSFYGSTADSILFPNGIEFSATDIQAPILTINAPIGLNFRDNPGNIVNQSSALQVLPSKTLALIGGDLSFEGGNLIAPGGRLELGSVSSESVVDWKATPEGFVGNYETVPNLGNIQLNQQTALDASGLSGGTIQIQGKNISLQDGSQIFAITQGIGDGGDIVINGDKLFISNQSGIYTANLGTGVGGNIKITATESIEMIGTGFEQFQNTFIRGLLFGNTTVESLQQGTGIVVLALGRGLAGNTKIDTSSLVMRNGALILSPTFVNANGGDIKINASESIELIGSALIGGNGLDSNGAAGNIVVDTKNLDVRDGGIIVNATFGDGNGGDIIVNVSDTINLVNTPVTAFVPTGILANSSVGTGQAGNIEINANNLFFEQGAAIVNNSGALILNQPSLGEVLPIEGGNAGNIKINVSNLIQITGISLNGITSSGIGSTAFGGNFSAGNIDISTKNLVLEDGAGIDAATTGLGKGGEIKIIASDSIVVRGKSPIREPASVSELPSSIAATSGRIDIPLETTGKAGNLNITTRNLVIENEGRIAVNGLSQGEAGELKINAESIILNNEGIINASTVSGEGGNITLQADKTITLQNGSLISTQASNNANGGNITINTDFIIATSNKDSDIVANAQRGRGGNIDITAEAVLGIKEGQAIPENGTNDIDASSEFGLNGNVTFNVPDTNNLQETINLPPNVLSTETITTNNCAVNTEVSSLIIQGRGGVSSPPDLPLGAEILLGYQESLKPDISQSHNQKISLIAQPVKTAQGDIYPARGIVVKEDGTLTLTAHTTNQLNQRTPNNLNDCNY